MDRDYKIFLEHIVESINYVQDFLKGVEKDEFDSSIKLQDAVVRRIEIIGEAAKNLTEDFKIENPQIPWRKMAGMRDNLIHEYFGVDTEEVWKTANEDLPELKKEIELLLK